MFSEHFSVGRDNAKLPGSLQLLKEIRNECKIYQEILTTKNKTTKTPITSWGCTAEGYMLNEVDKANVAETISCLNPQCFNPLQLDYSFSV